MSASPCSVTSALDGSRSETANCMQYRPQLSRCTRQPGPLQVHGGAWTSKDRTDNDFMAKALAESGIFVASIDFRMPPVAPHPGSAQDINLGIRWLKANAPASSVSPLDTSAAVRALFSISHSSIRVPGTVTPTPHPVE